MEENKKKEILCQVVSDKMEKSRVVSFVYTKKHPLYGKYVKCMKKFMIHDENNESKIGDMVTIEEIAPKSKNKKWQLVKVISHVE